MDGITILVGILNIGIPLGGALRLIHCLICISMDADQAPSYKRRIRNLLIFVAVSQCIGGLLLVIKNYY